MRYVIVNVEWAAARGIQISPEMRKSADGTRVVLHEEMVMPFLSEESPASEAIPMRSFMASSVDFESYSFDDAEFRELLASEEWSIPEGQTPEHTSAMGILQGLMNAEKSAKATINSLSLTDDEALNMKDWYPEWSEFIGKPVTAGMKMQHGGKLWKVRQGHTVQEQWKPGETGSESLYSEISESHSGSIDDPIPYNGNMELENGKHYIQGGITYKCTRDTGIPVHNPLKDLVGLYVEVAK